MTQPSSLRDIQVFFVMVDYYGKFILNFTKLAESLVRLLMKEVLFTWEKEQDSAFNALRKFLAASHLLVHPNSEKSSVLSTDSSNVTVGAILTQLNKKNLITQ